MKKPVKYALLGVGGIVLLLAAVVTIVAVTFDPNDYKPLIVKLVQDKKQRTLNIEGDIKLAFWPKIGADLGKISLSEHNSDKVFASVDGLKVSLALLPLLHKQLVVDTVYIDGAKAHIVRYKDGSTNFDDLLSQEEETSEQIKFDVDGIVVTDSAVTFDDQMTGKQYSVSQFNLETGHVALGEPFDLSTDFHVTASEPSVDANIEAEGNFMLDPDHKHYVVKGLDAKVNGKVADFNEAKLALSGDVDARPETLEFLVNGLKLSASAKRDGADISAEVEAPQLTVLKDEVSGKQARVSVSQQKGNDSLKAELVLADIKGSPTAIQSSSVSVDLTAKQGEHNIAGKFSSPFSGNLEKLVFDLPKLAGNIDVKDPALPKGAMQGTFAMQVHVDVKQELANSNFNLNIDNTKLKGDVGVAGFSKPNIKFNLTGDQLNLNQLLGNKPTAASDKPATTAQAAKPTDLSALKDLLLQGTVNIGSIVYDQYRLSGLKLGIKADGESLNVNPFAVKLDDSSIKGKFGITRFVKPIYNFDVDIDKLDADRYITKTEGEPAKKDTAAKSDPNAPIDLSALKNLNANGELRIGWLKLANITSTNVRIKLKADDGVAELAPFSANLYEGSMNGTLKVDARSTPSIAFKQDMKGIAIGPLLMDAINNDMLSGKGSLNVDVTTQGATVAALKKALDGSAAVNLSNGAVKGIDIAGTLRNATSKLNVLKGQGSTQVGDKSKQTDFSEMSATFNIKNGVASNNDLSMKAPLFRITGSGTIDIANETINYVAKPTVVATLKGQGGADLEALNGVTIPVKISGTFANPSYGIDFAALGTALAQKQLLDKVGGAKGEAVKDLIGGNKEEALKSLLGGKKTAPAETAPAAGEAAPPQPASDAKPATPEDKAKQKLKNILGF